jgi:hypothetical protein
VPAESAHTHQEKGPAQKASPQAISSSPSLASPSPALLQLALDDPAGASPRQILALQRVAGNRAVSQLLQA